MKKVSISRFLKNMNDYKDIIAKEDILVEKYGKPLFVVSNPYKQKIEKMKKLKGIIKTDIPYEKILEEREF